MALKMNIPMFSGSSPLVVFARASIAMNCKIQTMCVKTNISVSFTPPEVTDEDCLKILYYHHQNVTMCQRVVDIRMNEGIKELSKQIEPNISEVYTLEIENGLPLLDYHVVYEYDYSHCIYEVEIHEFRSLSLLQKFERFFEKIPHDSSIAFVFDEVNALIIINWGLCTFITFFVKALLRHLGRKTPVMAVEDENISCYKSILCLKGPGIVQTWLSNNEPGRDLIANLSTLKNKKAEFIINLSLYNPYIVPECNKTSSARNATSKYSNICLPTPRADERDALTFLSSMKNKQSDEAYSMHKINMEKYLRRTVHF